MSTPSAEIVSVQDGLSVDDADTTLQRQTAKANVKVQQKNLVQKIRHFGSLSEMIRMGGVAAMVVSMGLFLFDGLNIVNDTQRFMSMIMLSGLLSAGGFVLAFLLREQRGARAFFGLALLSVPVNFTVLGALMYSVFRFDGLSSTYPSLAEWQITDLASLGSTMLIALAVLIPITVFGVSIMARKDRGWLGTALLVSCGLLVLPVRDSVWIAPLVAMMVAALIVSINRFGKNAIALKTPAGRFVQCLLFLPPLIMLFRSFWLYEISELSAMMVALTLFAALRYFSQQLDTKNVLLVLSHIISAASAMMAAIFAMYALPDGVNSSVMLLTFCLPFGALMFELESRIKSNEMAEIMGIAAALILAIAVVCHQFLDNGLFVFATGFALLTILTVIAWIQKNKERLCISGIALLAIVVLNASEIAGYFVSAGWLGFAGLGALAIIMASLLERFGPVWSERLRRRIDSTC